MSGFSTVQLFTPLPPFCALWKGSLSAQSKVWEIRSTYLNVEYLPKLFGIFMQWRCVCSVPFIYFNPGGLMGIDFILWVIIQYYFIVYFVVIFDLP